MCSRAVCLFLELRDRAQQTRCVGRQSAFNAFSTPLSGRRVDVVVEIKQSYKVRSVFHATFLEALVVIMLAELDAKGRKSRLLTPRHHNTTFWTLRRELVAACGTYYNTQRAGLIISGLIISLFRSSPWSPRSARHSLFMAKRCKNKSDKKRRQTHRPHEQTPQTT